MDASEAYSDTTHAYPGIGRGRGGMVGGVNAEIFQGVGGGGSSNTYEVSSVEVKTVLGQVLNPLIIHHGPKANQATHFYINDMHTKSLGVGSYLLGVDGLPANEEDRARYEALSYDKQKQDEYLRTLTEAQNKSLDDVSVTTQVSANIAIRILDGAIEETLDEATRIGSYLQRLEYTDSNIVVMGENVQSAESLIRDADIAKEMTEYTKNNVLTQAAQSMLAQANQSSSAVLSLLQ